MEHQPNTELGLGSSDHRNLDSHHVHRNLEAMNIQELVSILRTAFRTEQFDTVEKVLVSRYNSLQTEILHLQDKFQLEKLIRFQAEQDLRKKEELCQKGKRAQNNYETLLKEVKKTSLVDSDIIAELRKKNNDLELEVSELRKLKERTKDAQGSSLAIIGELRKKNSELELEVCELRKLKEKRMDDRNTLSELPSKRFKDAHGASSSSSATTQTRGTTVDTSHLLHGHPITSLAGHAHVVEERQENENVHMSDSEEVIVMDRVFIPPSDAEEQMATQNREKRKWFAIKASPSSFDHFRFISLVHQQHYKFLTKEFFRVEQNLRVVGNKFSDIQAMIVARGWVELTSYAKDASATLGREFFANAYQEEYENNKNVRKKFTSFVRGKKVPFHEKIINELFGLENYEKCSFEERLAKSSCFPDTDICSTLCRPEAKWVLNKDGMPEKLRVSDLKPTAKAWAAFVLHNLCPSKILTSLTIRQATLVTAILKGEPVNVGRILADDLWGIANFYSGCVGHASLISKLCERVGVYPEEDEKMVKNVDVMIKYRDKY